jgi:hypothetical protein
VNNQQHSGWPGALLFPCMVAAVSQDLSVLIGLEISDLGRKSARIKTTRPELWQDGLQVGTAKQWFESVWFPARGTNASHITDGLRLFECLGLQGSQNQVAPVPAKGQGAMLRISRLCRRRSCSRPSTVTDTGQKCVNSLSMLRLTGIDE